MLESVANRFAASEPETSATTHARRSVDFLRAGNPRPVLEATARAIHDDTGGVLALVLEAEGSTYVDRGAMALFAGGSQTGWLSGGCLEPELARRAAKADADGRIGWLEIDTRDDSALFSGAAIGCRGRLRVALLPLRLLPGAAALLDAWQHGGQRLDRRLDAAGRVQLGVGRRRQDWQLPAAALDWHGTLSDWILPLPRPPEACLLGAGPETPTLLRMLAELGWRTTLCEHRPRWRDAGHLAGTLSDAAPADALHSRPCDAVLVMHHDFELDREALETVSESDALFVGLLGPPRRREDLLRLLASAQRKALLPRLHAPVGLDLGGKGPESIALSIAAQLQAWRGKVGMA